MAVRQAWRWRWGALLGLWLGAHLDASAQSYVSLAGLIVQDIELRPGRQTVQVLTDPAQFPTPVNVQTRLRVLRPEQWRWFFGQPCSGLDARVDLPVAQAFAGQSIYRVPGVDHLGLLVWIGAAHQTPTALQGSRSWQRVFERQCGGSPRGVQVAVHPVLLDRGLRAGSMRSYRYPNQRIKLGAVRLFAHAPDRFRGRTEVDVYLQLGNLTLAVDAKSCHWQIPSQVQLMPVSRARLASAGQEVHGGAFAMTLGCGEGVLPDRVMLTDLLQPANRSETLSTQSGPGQAQGVALKLYQNGAAPQAMRLGYDLLGAPNRWLSSSATQQFQVFYVRRESDIQAGQVQARALVTVFYP